RARPPPPPPRGPPRAARPGAIGRARLRRDLPAALPPRHTGRGEDPGDGSARPAADLADAVPARAAAAPRRRPSRAPRPEEDLPRLLESHPRPRPRLAGAERGAGLRRRNRRLQPRGDHGAARPRLRRRVRRGRLERAFRGARGHPYYPGGGTGRALPDDRRGRRRHAVTVPPLVARAKAAAA